MKRIISCILLPALLLTGCQNGAGKSSAPAEITAVTTESSAQTTAVKSGSESTTAATAETTAASSDKQEKTETDSSGALQSSTLSDAELTPQGEPAVTEKAGTAAQAVPEIPSGTRPKNDEPIELPIIPIR